jgi:purine-nucleoside phosphorylase
MIYILCALKSEAQAFVEFFKLQKNKLDRFTLFDNETIRLIISGIGIENARYATQTLINHYDITPQDIYLNVGICGASKHFMIGECIKIGAIEYKKQLFEWDRDAPQISCLDYEANTPTYTIVDMESYGFYDAVIHNPAIEQFYIYKVVSDHFDPKSVTKEKTKSLIFNAIHDITPLTKDNN